MSAHDQAGSDRTSYHCHALVIGLSDPKEHPVAEPLAGREGASPSFVALKPCSCRKSMEPPCANQLFVSLSLAAMTARITQSRRHQSSPDSFDSAVNFTLQGTLPRDSRFRKLSAGPTSATGRYNRQRWKFVSFASRLLERRSPNRRDRGYWASSATGPGKREFDWGSLP